ncbi:hypothetical protein [Phenylobacterium sp.]|uniref:hypothetical protein n=1 Tax=Phenylobacterium sp. TaxID=1871053 RepID=UPI003D2E91D6
MTNDNDNDVWGHRSSTEYTPGTPNWVIAKRREQDEFEALQAKRLQEALEERRRKTPPKAPIEWAAYAACLAVILAVLFVVLFWDYLLMAAATVVVVAALGLYWYRHEASWERNAEQSGWSQALMSRRTPLIITAIVLVAVTIGWVVFLQNKERPRPPDLGGETPLQIAQRLQQHDQAVKRTELNAFVRGELPQTFAGRALITNGATASLVSSAQASRNVVEGCWLSALSDATETTRGNIRSGGLKRDAIKSALGAEAISKAKTCVGLAGATPADLPTASMTDERMQAALDVLSAAIEAETR